MTYWDKELKSKTDAMCTELKNTVDTAIYPATARKCNLFWDVHIMAKY